MTRDTDSRDDTHARGQLGAPRQAELTDFFGYWQSMRRGADVPRRTDIDPRGIEALLSNTFIAERIAPGLARMRIAGSHLADLMGMEVRGMPISAFIAPSHRDALSHHLVRVFDQPAILRLGLASPGRAGDLAGQMLILPLRSDLGDISRALGCLVTSGDPGRGPRRFEITAAHVTPLGDTEAQRAPTGFAESQARLSAEGSAARKGERPYLRLIKS